MFFYAAIWGNKLPDKVLCLTFDDGPDDFGGKGGGGPQTLNLARFLHERGVPATFFMLGDRARKSLDTMVALRDMGHLIGNHTDCHPNLVKSTAEGGNPVPHVLSADLLIRNTLFSKSEFLTGATYFRPPFGKWRNPEGNYSLVAAPLNQEKLLARCIGPINWDIDSRDWACWRDGVSTETCAQECLERIEQKRKGIVLLHDSNFEEDIRRGNNTYELCKILIPELQARGYRFVRLDAVPQAASAALVTQRFCLKTADGKRFVSIAPKLPGSVLTSVAALGEHEEFGLVELDDGRVAIRVYNGEFLSVHGAEDSYICSFKPKIGATESFQMIRLTDHKVAFKLADSEQYLSVTPDGAGGDVAAPGASATFLFEAL